MPPAWMWHLDEELEDWFDLINDKNDPEDDNDEPMDQNVLSKGRR